MHPQQLRPIASAALTALALIVFAPPAPAQSPDNSPTTGAQTQDLRSPDTRDAANSRRNQASKPGGTTDVTQNARSAPAYCGTSPCQHQQDRRSPDAQDAALISQGLIEHPTTSTVSATRSAAPTAIAGPRARFDRGDAAIGAAGALGLALLATGVLVAVRRRSHRNQPVTA